MSRSSQFAGMGTTGAAGAATCSAISSNRAATLLPVLADVSMCSIPLLRWQAWHQHVGGGHQGVKGSHARVLRQPA